MGTKAAKGQEGSTESDAFAKLRSQHGTGPIDLAGTENALYERHLVFDNVVDLAIAGPRERFEALAHSVRDILSRRWIKTGNTYASENPKRVYYLSMEFLIGRSLANNVMNLMLDPVSKQARSKKEHLDWLELSSTRNPTPAWVMGDSGAWPLASSESSMATMQLPAIGYGLRYEYGMFKQTIQNWLAAGEAPTIGSVIRTPGKSRALTNRSEINLHCYFRGASWCFASGRRQGIQLDRRPV